MEKILLVFLKEPVPGKVKTRLAASVGAERASQLYVRMARKAWDAARKARGITPVVAYDGRAPLDWLAAPAPPSIPQEGPGLGERLAGALGRYPGPVAAIGGDCPALTPALIEAAFSALGTSDLALGPAEDGGYYLIALKKPRPELFAGIDWSTPRVLEQTLSAAARLGLTHTLLETLFDVDDQPSLERWLKEEDGQRDEVEP